jgi:hypothetical protein
MFFLALGNQQAVFVKGRNIEKFVYTLAHLKLQPRRLLQLSNGSER